MSRSNDMTVERGATLFGPTQVLDSAETKSLYLRGMEKEFENRDYADRLGAVTQYDQRRTTCVLLRNMVSANVTPRQAVNIDPNHQDIASVATAPGLNQGIVDPYLPAAGCRQYDYCWVAIKGPTEGLTPATDASVNITAGAVLEPTTGGRLIVQPAFTAPSDAATTLAVFVKVSGYTGTADAAVAKTAHDTAVPLTLKWKP
jgi:hypothetical protein